MSHRNGERSTLKLHHAKVIGGHWNDNADFVGLRVIAKPHGDLWYCTDLTEFDDELHIRLQDAIDHETILPKMEVTFLYIDHEQNEVIRARLEKVTFPDGYTGVRPEEEELE